MPVLKYELTLTEPMLGSKPSNEKVFTDFILSKKEDKVDSSEDEIQAAKEAGDRLQESITVFHRNEEGNPIIWDYQLKGFFKDACGALRRVPGTKSSELKAYKTVIDTTVFVRPRKIDLILPEGSKIEILERPLRAETMQGPRVALSKSEMVPAGTKLMIEIESLIPRTQKIIEEWLNYGSLRGLGQWRNASYGRFSFKEIK